MDQRKLILSMSITFDGYIAGPNDEMDWMKPSADDWNDLFTDLNEADTYLLGRKMYPGYSQYWQSVLKNPSSSDANELRFAKLAEKTQHIVFTKGNFTPDWNNTRVAHNATEEIKNLKTQPGKNIIAWGGAEFAANLLKLGLIDEIRLSVNQTILGEGKNLFSHLKERVNLALISTSEMKTGVVVLRYKIEAYA